jgi:hypothetical protein
VTGEVVIPRPTGQLILPTGEVYEWGDDSSLLSGYARLEEVQAEVKAKHGLAAEVIRREVETRGDRWQAGGWVAELGVGSPRYHAVELLQALRARGMDERRLSELFSMVVKANGRELGKLERRNPEYAGIIDSYRERGTGRLSVAPAPSEATVAGVIEQAPQEPGV